MSKFSVNFETLLLKKRYVSISFFILFFLLTANVSSVFSKPKPLKIVNSIKSFYLVPIVASKSETYARIAGSNTVRFVAPNFSSSVPVNGATSISKDANIVLNFDVAIASATVNATNIIVSGSFTGQIAGSFSGGGSTQLTFNPTSDFKSGELITVRLTTGLQADSGGEPLTKSIFFSFVVQANGTGTIFDVSPPVESQISTSQDAPRDIRPIDLDKDGDIDFLVTSTNDATVAWYENNGSQVFTKHTITSSLANPTVAVAKDLDGDGDIDVVSVSETGDTLVWFENDGIQNFASAVTLGTPNRPVSIDVVDVDSDGDLDILSASLDDDTIAWYENDGSESFTKQTITSSLTTPFSVSSADMDGDGDLDVLVADFSNDINYWYDNGGSQSFTQKTLSVGADGARSLLAVDLDKDGDMDAIGVGQNGNTVSWFENNGSESFTAHNLTTSLTGPTTIRSMDIDGDGDNDLVACGNTNNRIAVYQNDGSESFTEIIINSTASGVTIIEPVDLDGDNTMDLVATLNSTDEIVWYKNKIVPKFSSSVPANGATSISKDANIVLNFDVAIASATVNATNIIVSGSFTGQIAGSFSGGGSTQLTFDPTSDFKSGELITVTLTTGLQTDSGGEPLAKPIFFSFVVQANGTDTTFDVSSPSERQISISQDSPRDIRPIDLDTDGDIDFLVTSIADATVAWYENNGSQVFTKHIITNSLANPTVALTKDLDGDGDIDVVSVSETGDTLVWFENGGSQNFASAVTLGTPNRPISIDVVDIDGDGDLDILSASLDDDTVAWYENDGSESFTKQTIDLLPSPFSISSADMDGDGDLDLMMADIFQNIMYWYENDGSQNFTRKTIATGVIGARSLLAVDLDKDGDMDAIGVGQNGNTVSWFENNGSESFTTHNLTSSLNGPTSIRSMDIDGDGDNDLVACGNLNNRIAVYQNDGSEHFTEIIINYTASGVIIVEPVDLDGDNTMDLVATLNSTDEIVWYKNKTFSNWLGTTTDWNTTSNWSSGAVPTSLDDVVIPSLANLPVASGAISVNELVIESSAGLTVNGDITSTKIIVNGGSIIANANVTGTLIYNRNNLTSSVWYGIAAPVTGQSIDGFVGNHRLATGTGSNIGLGTYNNATPGWDYYENGTGEPSVNFGAGKGRIVNLSSGNLNFVGSFNTSDVNDIGITLGLNGFNLLGNPYPSFIDGNTILTANNSLLSEQTFWIWNQSTSSYDTFNLASSLKIAPTQGFFVKANQSSSSFTITESTQSIESTDTFQRLVTNRPEISISLLGNSLTRSSDIYYIDGTTTGWDNGYDSTIFEGAANEFMVYTGLVSNDSGQKLAIQSLPPSDYENMIIPVGINAISGTAITIKANAINFPVGINIYLEDKDHNSFTLLDASSDYTATLSEGLLGFGRYYLHTSSEALSIDDVNLDHISAYLSEKNNIRIVGIEKGNAHLEMYSILGSQVRSTSFIGKGVNNISLPNLTVGLYILQIKTDAGVFRKKIIMK